MQKISKLFLHRGSSQTNNEPKLLINNLLFNFEYYLTNNPDVKEANLEPLSHYIKYGWKENRNPSAYFDIKYYLENNPDVKETNLEPLAHYIEYGWKENRNPSAYFDIKYYLENNPDVKEAKLEPLAHYINFGKDEGRLCTGITTFSPQEDKYQTWIRNNLVTPKIVKALQDELAIFSQQPKISVIMPTFNPDIKLLKEAIDSVLNQYYANWELCIADDCSTIDEFGDFLDTLKDNNKIKLTRRKKNGHISQATNSAASLASGDYLLFLDQDDVLTTDCLLQIAIHICKTKNDVIYSDDDKIDDQGNRFDPQFKPDWSPELLLSYMYFSHAFVVKKSLFDLLGGFRTGYEGSQDYDFALRVTEKTNKIGHIQTILYHWRAIPGSTAMGGNEKNYSLYNGLKAVQDALNRRNINGEVYQKPWASKNNLGIFSIRFKIDNEPSVSIIIPTKDKIDLLKPCIQSVLDKTDYVNYKILIIDNGSEETITLNYFEEITKNPQIEILSIASINGQFNYSRLNNLAVQHANSEYILLLNNDTEVISSNWLKQMMGYALIEGVGAVGAKLLFPNNTIQHAGVVHGYNNGLCGTAFRGLPDSAGGYLSYAMVSRNYSGVTAACLLVKKSLYQKINGLDEINFAVAYNDVDFCYRILEAGYRNIFCSDAVLYHYEGYTRGYVDNPLEELNFKSKYTSFYDRYYSPNLSLLTEKFAINPFGHILQQKSGKKIAAFSHNLNLEGAPNSMLELITGVNKLQQFAKIDVFSPYDGELAKEYCKNNIYVNKIESPNLNDFAQSINVFFNLVELIKNYDVIYANTMELFYVILAAKIAGIPSIWNIRESEDAETYYTDKIPKYFEKEALKCFGYPYANVFVANSTANGKNKFNYKNNFTVIHNGLNIERIIQSIARLNRDEERTKLLITEKDLVILITGTVCARKGQQDLIKAFQLLEITQTQNVKILIVGDRDSEYSRELHSLVQHMTDEYKSQIIIIPETKDVYRYYYVADIFVCTSKVESFPRVILEAMYFGLPIITTPVFGITEQVRENINALLYSPDDINKLHTHLITMLNNNELRTKFAHNSKILFKLITNYDDMVEHYATLFTYA